MSVAQAVRAVCEGRAAVGLYAPLGHLGDHARASFLARLLAQAGFGPTKGARGGGGRAWRGGGGMAVCRALEEVLGAAEGEVDGGAEILFMPPGLLAAQAALSPGRDAGVDRGAALLWHCAEGSVTELVFRATMLAASANDDAPFTPTVEAAAAEAAEAPLLLAGLARVGPRFAALRRAVTDLRVLRACAVRLTACLATAAAPPAAPNLAHLLGSPSAAHALGEAVKRQPTEAGLYLLSSLSLPACATALRSLPLLTCLGCPHLACQAAAAAGPAAAAAPAAGSDHAAFLDSLRARVLVLNAEQGFEPPTSAHLSAAVRSVHVERAEGNAAAADRQDAVLPWAEVAGRLVHPSRRGAMAMARHAPAVARMMAFARHHFADAYTADEALTTPVAEALERLPRGDRETGWNLLRDFLEAWAELRLGLATYDMCPAEARAVGAMGAAIEPLVAQEAAAAAEEGGGRGGRGGEAASGVVVMVAHLVGLPGEEAVPSNPVPRMLAGRLLKDSNAVAGSTGVAAVLADPFFNLRGALGGGAPPAVRASDVPWLDDAAAVGMLVTGAKAGLEGDAMDREVDDVVGCFARWSSENAALRSAQEWQEAAAARAAEEAALARGDRLHRVRLRIIEDELYIRCPRCRNPFVDYSDCDALRCTYPNCDGAFCSLCLVRSAAHAIAFPFDIIVVVPTCFRFSRFSVFLF